MKGHYDRSKAHREKAAAIVRKRWESHPLCGCGKHHLKITGCDGRPKPKQNRKATVKVVAPKEAIRGNNFDSRGLLLLLLGGA